MVDARAEPLARLGPRINVVGSSGSGKSTLGEELARRLGVPFIELDALYWRPGWVGAPEAEFRAAIEAATAGEGWVVAGSSAVSRAPRSCPRLTDVVRLDYSLPLLLRRLGVRSWRRWRSSELLWGTNRESFARQLYNPKGVLLYTLRHYHAGRRQLAREMAAPEWAHGDFVRLRSPAAAAPTRASPAIRPPHGVLA